MIDRKVEIDPTLYVKAAHFMHGDDAALFGALAKIGRTVDLVIVEDPENPLLRRHAEIRADEMIAAVGNAGEKFSGTKFAEMTSSLFGGEGARDRLIDDELVHLGATMTSPGMGVFAVYGAEVDVAEFIKAHLDQPSSR